MGLKDVSNHPKKEQIQFDLRKVSYILIPAVLIIAVLFVVFFLRLPGTVNAPKHTEAEVLGSANKIDAVSAFTRNNPDYDVQIVFLTSENVTSLAKEFPALYGDIPNKEIYRVEYVSNSDRTGIFVILDDKLEVIKYFKMYSVGLESLKI